MLLNKMFNLINKNYYNKVNNNNKILLLTRD